MVDEERTIEFLDSLTEKDKRIITFWSQYSHDCDAAWLTPSRWTEEGDLPQLRAFLKRTNGKLWRVRNVFDGYCCPYEVELWREDLPFLKTKYAEFWEKI